MDGLRCAFWGRLSIDLGKVLPMTPRGHDIRIRLEKLISLRNKRSHLSNTKRVGERLDQLEVYGIIPNLLDLNS